MIAGLQRTYSNYILKPILKRYLKKERTYTRDGISIKIRPGVFHPKYFFSTQVLLEFMDSLSLNGKLFCEPGCGSGIISLYAYKKGANVLSFDISREAVTALEENFKSNFPNDPKRNFKVLVSDVFENMPHQKFDYMIINPPYFFKDAGHVRDKAWYCGENGEYFRKLFLQLPDFMSGGEVFMILGDNCDIERIKQIAAGNSIIFELIKTQKVKWEKNYIFKLNLNS
jgi:release factor glutamine methyltransferase